MKECDAKALGPVASDLLRLAGLANSRLVRNSWTSKKHRRRAPHT